MPIFRDGLEAVEVCAHLRDVVDHGSDAEDGWMSTIVLHITKTKFQQIQMLKSNHEAVFLSFIHSQFKNMTFKKLYWTSVYYVNSKIASTPWIDFPLKTPKISLLLTFKVLIGRTGYMAFYGATYRALGILNF